MGHVLNSAVRICRFITTIIALSMAAATAAALQHPTGDAARARMQNDSKRETQLRADGSQPAKSVDPKRLKAAMDQIEEDFKRILTLHNELGRAAAAGSLDYGFVSEATGEIRKRASRLRTTLALDKAEGGEPDPQNRRKFSDAEVKDALIELCKEIESFVKNPVIESPGTVDLQQTARAGRDLESVIDLSGRIKKTAEKLARTSK